MQLIKIIIFYVNNIFSTNSKDYSLKNTFLKNGFSHRGNLKLIYGNDHLIGYWIQQLLLFLFFLAK